jgi:hypothetical protein
MRHELKTWPQYFCRVKDGSKTFEVRKNDRGFQNGDTVILREWDPEPKEVSGPPPELQVLHSLSPRTHLVSRGYTSSDPIEFKVGYVFQLDAERVVFALIKTPEGNL